LELDERLAQLKQEIDDEMREKNKRLHETLNILNTSKIGNPLGNKGVLKDATVVAKRRLELDD